MSFRRLAASTSVRAAASAAAATVAAASATSSVWVADDERQQQRLPLVSAASCEQSPAARMSSDSRSRGPKLLFLGSGSSTGCPKPLCALAFPDTRPNAYANAGNDDGDDRGGYGYSCSCRDTAGGDGGGASSSLAAIGDDGDPALAALQEQLGHTCRTSQLAAVGDPRRNKNYRSYRTGTTTTAGPSAPSGRNPSPFATSSSTAARRFEKRRCGGCRRTVFDR